MVRPSPKTRTIRQSVRFPAPPKVVYDALAESKRHTAFTGSPAQIHANPQRSTSG